MPDEFSNEPAIRDRVTLETQDGPRTLVHTAMIANLTTEEVWVVVGVDVGQDLVSGSPLGSGGPASPLRTARPLPGLFSSEPQLRRASDRAFGKSRLVQRRGPYLLAPQALERGKVVTDLGVGHLGPDVHHFENLEKEGVDPTPFVVRANSSLLRRLPRSTVEPSRTLPLLAFRMR